MTQYILYLGRLVQSYEMFHKVNMLRCGKPILVLLTLAYRVYINYVDYNI